MSNKSLVEKLGESTDFARRYNNSSILYPVLEESGLELFYIPGSVGKRLCLPKLDTPQPRQSFMALYSEQKHTSVDMLLFTAENGRLTERLGGNRTHYFHFNFSDGDTDNISHLRWISDLRDTAASHIISGVLKTVWWWAATGAGLMFERLYQDISHKQNISSTRPNYEFLNAVSGYVNTHSEGVFLGAITVFTAIYGIKTFKAHKKTNLTIKNAQDILSDVNGRGLLINDGSVVVTYQGSKTPYDSKIISTALEAVAQDRAS